MTWILQPLAPCLGRRTGHLMGGSGCWANSSKHSAISNCIQQSAFSPAAPSQTEAKTFETQRNGVNGVVRNCQICQDAKESKLSAVTPRVAIFNHQSLAILPALSLQLNSTCIPIPLLLPSWKIQAFSPATPSQMETKPLKHGVSGGNGAVRNLPETPRLPKNPNSAQLLREWRFSITNLWQF